MVKIKILNPVKKVKVNTKGGKREGAGRKPYTDRNLLKEQFSIYITKEKIDKLGGPELTRSLIYNFIEKL